MLGAVILLGCSVQLLQFDWSVVQMVQVHLLHLQIVFWDLLICQVTENLSALYEMDLTDVWTH